MSQGNTPVSAGPSGRDASGPALYELIRRGRSFSGHEQNCSFLNLGDGRFANVSAASGFNFPDDGRSIGRVDWDLDGDLDFWIANRSGPQVRLLLNELPTVNKSVTLVLEGTECNRDAIGARVEVSTSDSATPMLRTVRAGDGFLAQSSKQVHFGLGDREILEVVVRWPGGEPETFAGVTTGGRYRLKQGTGSGQPLDTKRPPKLISTKLDEPEAAAASRVFLSSMFQIPEINYRGQDGTPRVLGGSAMESKPTLINLWASWCVPCAKELQEWSQQESDLQLAGVHIIALSVDALDVEQGSTQDAAVPGATHQIPVRVWICRSEDGRATPVDPRPLVRCPSAVARSFEPAARRRRTRRRRLSWPRICRSVATGHLAFGRLVKIADPGLHAVRWEMALPSYPPEPARSCLEMARTRLGR